MPTKSLGPFLRASSLHIGAAAAAAALRRELVDEDRALDAPNFDAAYAVARLTPGTNLLAFYALLGHRLDGWWLALKAVAVGALVPASVAVLVAFLYTDYSSATLSSVMAGARAGGIAVFLGAAVRLLKPQVAVYPRLAVVFAVTAFLAAWMLPVNLFTVLLLSGGVGAFLLRPVS